MLGFEIYSLLIIFAIFVAIFIIGSIVLLIYLPPFFMWLAYQHNNNRYTDVDPVTPFQSLRCATILYKSFLTKKKPVF